MEELNKKLAEGVGFKRARYTTKLYDYPDKSKYCASLPDLTNSLDACFKWLVPKLKRTEFRLHMWRVTKGWCVNVLWLEDLGGRRRERVTSEKYEAVDEHPALALCKAVEKLIDGEKDA